MPRISEKNKLLDKLGMLELKVSEARLRNLQDTDDEDDEDDEEFFDVQEYLIITPPSPVTPFLSDVESDSSASSQESTEKRAEHYHRLLGAIRALKDEVKKARVINHIVERPLRAAQLHLLDHFADFRPHLFRKKVRVDPDVFDLILDQISDNPIFKSNSNRLQLPIAIQLAIFLNRLGHYGNAASPEDIAQWAGVSVGSVINCTNRVMVGILDQHDDFISVPTVDSEDVKRAHAFVTKKSCPAWSGGIFAVDGSTINLHEKPSFYGDIFVDRKDRFSLNCQAVVMPHNLLIVDYGLGHPGSVHDAHAFQGTQIGARDGNQLPEDHWIWADSAYPAKSWCAVPFKAIGGRLSKPQNLFNRHLSKVRICAEHAFAALKGRFQSLKELRLQIRTRDDLKYAVHWIQCCFILHNMIIRFEEQLGKEPTVPWAVREGFETLERGREIEIIDVPADSPGQQLRVRLMNDLFTELQFPYVVNAGQE